jgi:hypothetical protein
MNTIHNARITLGVGAIVAGIVAPMVNGRVGDLAHVLVRLVFGAKLIAMAQTVLGRLRT